MSRHIELVFEATTEMCFVVLDLASDHLQEIDQIESTCN